MRSVDFGDSTRSAAAKTLHSVVVLSVAGGAVTVQP